MSSQTLTAPPAPQAAISTIPGRDLVSIRDLSPIEVESIFHLATLMKSRPQDFRSALAGKHIAMFFEKPSLRTRLTFEAGICGLGGTVTFVDQRHERLDARETLSDIAHNLERWVGGIVLRTFAHETVEGMAEHALCAGDQRAQRGRASLPGIGRLLYAAREIRKSEKDLPGICRRRKQRNALVDADVSAAGIDDSYRDAQRLRPESADSRRRPRHCKEYGREN